MINKTITKKQVQQRVIKDGKPLDFDKFEWDEKTNTFSSKEEDLILEFKDIHNCTFKTGNNCTFNTGSYCTFKTEKNCTFYTGSYCTFYTGSYCTFYTGSYCTFKTNSHCTFKTESECTFDTESECTFDTESECTFNTSYYCTFNTSYYCTFKTGYWCTFETSYECTFKTNSHCTFKTESECTFDTGSYCTFKTGSHCTFNTDHECTFKTGSDCVIVNRNVFEVILPKKGDTIQICPHIIEGHLINGKLNGVSHIIADGILSEIISQKGSVYKVRNYNEEGISYLIEKDEIYSHGKTLKEAKDDLIYKVSNRDTSKYNSLTLDSLLTKEECIKAYITITGACSEGTKYFVNQQSNVKDNYTIKEIIELTKGQYNSNVFEQFFNK